MRGKTGLVGVLALVLAGSMAYARSGAIVVSAGLESTQEVPAVASPARGRFVALIDDHERAVAFELTYSGLQADVRQAHIHFAQRNVNGGIMVWLCGTATNPGPTGTQVCPQAGRISGVITPGHVQAVLPQGIAEGDFDDFIRALRSGLAYANVHTAQSPGGEIRGQIRPGAGHR
jgi:hypothetical protein